MPSFRQELREQRWDDHRYYHHSRVNQSLHLGSALGFVCAYATALRDPAGASLIGWLLAMTSRQAGHFFFEPKTYDVANQATHEYKEAVKVGYNLRRKTVLMTLWLASPLLLVVDPTLLGTIAPHERLRDFIRHVGYLWLLLGVGALTFRTIQLFFVESPQSGVVWAIKILTDPFHDIKLYYRAPARLLRGELLEPTAASERKWRETPP